MRLFKLLALCFLLTTQVAQAAKKGVTVFVNLSPAGSFEAKSSRVKGHVIKKGDKWMTTKEGVWLSAKTLKTGMDLRDEHLHKRFKNPKIHITKAIGKGGKGKAEIVINGIKKRVPFSYKEKGKYVGVTFKISLKDFKFEGINYMGVGVKDTVRIEANIKAKK